MRAFLIVILFARLGAIEYGMAYTTQQQYGGQQEIEEFNSDFDDLIGYIHDEEGAAINGYSEEDQPLEAAEPAMQRAEIQWNRQRYVEGKAGVVHAHKDPKCKQYNGYTRTARVSIYIKRIPCKRSYCKHAMDQAAQLVRAYLTDQGKRECHKYVKHKGCRKKC